MTITREALAAMFPRAIPEWLDALYELAPVLGAHYEWNRLDWVHFCGQIAAETNSLTLREMRENMSFSTQKRILEVYSYRLGVALSKEKALRDQFGTREKLAAYLVRKPKELADLVYGGREGTPWREGSKYIGRGPTQITHKNNYRAVGEEIAQQPGGDAFDLVNNPDLLATDPELGIRSAFADWHIKGLSRYAQKDDCDTLSDALNTGNVRDNVKPHGLPRRRLETNNAKKIWRKDFVFLPVEEKPEPTPVPEPVPAPPLPPVTVPTTPGELAKVSRKASFFVWLYRTAVTALGGFTLTGVADTLGFAKGVYNDLALFIKDHSLLVIVCGLVFAATTARWILSLMAQDAAAGTYVPSKLAEAEGGGAQALALVPVRRTMASGAWQGSPGEHRDPDPEAGRIGLVGAGPLPGPQ